MQINTDGLIIREQSIGESDRLVTVLTREQGILRAFVRGAKAMKSRSASSTQLLCYSRLSIYEGREKIHNRRSGAYRGVFFAAYGF